MGTLNDVFWEGRVVVAKTGNLMTDRHNYTGKLINLCKLVVFSPKKKKKERERRITTMPVSLGCCKRLNKIIYIRHLKHLASLNGSHAIFDLLL